MNKKAFTLVELLAVIIVIGLISIITIPKINNSLDNSKKKIAEASALSYTKSIYDTILSSKMNDEKIVLNGAYNINQNGNIYNSFNEYELEFTGTRPKKGLLTFLNNELQSACITINNYMVTISNDEVTNSEKGECQEDLQIALSVEVSSYVKRALEANSALTVDTVKTVAQMSDVTMNKADSGWIEFKYDNSVVSVNDYSLTYGTLTANYSSLTNGNYISEFGEFRNAPL